MAEQKDVFSTLNKVDCSERVEKKKVDNKGKELSYLSWAWAWAEVKKRFPNTSYEIIKFNGLPYVFDPNTGYMVYTTVTIDGITHEMWLPVMDSHNAAMKKEPYEVKTKFSSYTVAAATMFDINKTIMRCLTKNLAMFGLGLYIYAGEDLPEDVEQDDDSEEDKKTNSKKSSAKSKSNKKVEDPPESNNDAVLCVSCHSAINDYVVKDSDGNPKTYPKQSIIDRSMQLFNKPVCMTCMMKAADKARKAKDQEVNENA